jgi:hypothetical protein
MKHWLKLTSSASAISLMSHRKCRSSSGRKPEKLLKQVAGATILSLMLVVGITPSARAEITSKTKDELQRSIQQCWNVSALSSEALRTTVSVTVSLGRDGRPDVSSIGMAEFSGGSKEAAQQVYEVARKAIVRCGRDGFQLPEDKYEDWKELLLIFDASRMGMR